MNDDTDLGGVAERFPATQGTLVRAIGSDDPAERRRAEATLVAAYWKPIYKYIRCRWQVQNDDAKDLTQAFLARAVERDFFARFDPAKGRFRTFVRVCVDRFVANARRSAGRRPDRCAWSLDFADAEGELGAHPAAPQVDPEEFFRQQWLRGLLAQAVETLRHDCAAAGKETHFALFERYDLDDAAAAARPTYAQLAEEFRLPTTQVTNYLAWTRRKFRELIHEALRGCCGSEDDYRQEVRRLFGEGLQ